MKSPAFSYYMHDGPTAFSIELAGALAAEAAKKLEQDWRSAAEVIGEKELVIDFSYVTEIDPVGRQLLLHWRRNGATLVANRPESRALAESIIGRTLPPIGRIANTSSPYRPGSFFRDVLPIIGLLALLVYLPAPQRSLFQLFNPQPLPRALPLPGISRGCMHATRSPSRSRWRWQSWHRCLV